MADYRVSYSFSVKDADGEITSITLYRIVADTLTVAQLFTNIGNVALSVDSVLAGQIVSWRIGFEQPNATGKSAPVAQSDIEETGLFTWGITGSTLTMSTDFPAFLETLFTGNVVNVTDPTVAAFITGISGTNGYVDRYGNPKGELVNAVKTFRKHRMQTRRARMSL